MMYRITIQRMDDPEAVLRDVFEMEQIDATKLGGPQILGLRMLSMIKRLNKTIADQEQNRVGLQKEGLRKLFEGKP